MSNGHSYRYEYDERYCYPKSNVLKNKLGITNEKELWEAELEISSLKMARARINKIAGDFDLPHLKKIHKFIFEDIYEWAGEIRWVNIAKGNFFCNYEFIEKNAADLFQELKDENYLDGTKEAEMPLRLAYYLSEINVIHPFREGNGRTQRLFIAYLAEKNGYILDFGKVNKEEMIQASAEAFMRNYDKMNLLFQSICRKQQRCTQ